MDGFETQGIKVSQGEPIPAGAFSRWLEGFRASLRTGCDNDVACGDCRGCCSSGYFIHVAPTDAAALKAIPKPLLFAAPGLPKGNFLMSHAGDGLCPMLRRGDCSIYAERPATCRKYDCRIFAAAGIEAGDDRTQEINERVRRWRFAYPAPQDRRLHEAVLATARFLRDKAAAFPGGRCPQQPSQVALTAIQAHAVFLQAGVEELPDEEIARMIIAAASPDLGRGGPASEPAPHPA